MTIMIPMGDDVREVRGTSAGDLPLHAPELSDRDFLVVKLPTGAVLAVPADAVPAVERDLWEDAQLRRALWRGFDDAVCGRVTALDDVLAELDFDLDDFDLQD